MRSSELAYFLSKIIAQNKENAGERGSVLVMIIISIVIIASIGAAMLTTSTSTMYTQIGSVDSLNGYFLAEGGRDYALNQIKWELANNRSPTFNSSRSCEIFNNDDCTSATPKTFSLPDSVGQFSLSLTLDPTDCDNDDIACTYILTSTGIPNAGTNRVLTFEISAD